MCFQEAPIYMESSFTKLHFALGIGRQFIFSLSFSLLLEGSTSPSKVVAPWVIFLATPQQTEYFFFPWTSYDSGYWADWRCSCKAVLNRALYSGCSFWSLFLCPKAGAQSFREEVWETMHKSCSQRYENRVSEQVSSQPKLQAQQGKKEKGIRTDNCLQDF